MLRPTISEDELRTFIGGADKEHVVELAPHKYVRTFKAADEIVRISLLENDDAIRCESIALKTIGSASTRPLAPRLIEDGHFQSGDHAYPFLRYQWVDGQTLVEQTLQTRIGDISQHLLNLHDLHVFDLLHRFPRRAPNTLMKSFKRASDRLKEWMLHREHEGLEPDLLTLSLSDIQRALRQYAVAQDHFFQSAIRPVLCHGQLTPSVIIHPRASQSTYTFVGFEHSYLGDAASDLATMAIECNLDEDVEHQLLVSYLEASSSQPNTDRHLIPRYYARKFLRYLERPIQLAHEVLLIKNGNQQTIRDPMVTIEESCETIYEELVQTFNALRPFMGSARPLSVREVKAMGRITAYEEMLLQGRTFRISISGRPYSGVTEVATSLAKRLRHAYVNTSALTWLGCHLYKEANEDNPPTNVHDALNELTKHDIQLQPVRDGTLYRVLVDDCDVTDTFKSEEMDDLVARFEADPQFPNEMRTIFQHFGWESGCIMEGPGVDHILRGKVHSFFLTCDDELRAQRLINAPGHRLTTDEAADALAKLDSENDQKIDDKIVIDGANSVASASALQIIWKLLPPGRRPNLENHSMSGRNLLFTI